MGIAFVPLYIRALGADAYGLVGVFMVLQASLTLLDLGMTQTLTREMSRLQAGAHTAQSIRDLLRSFEHVYLVLALTMVAVVWLGSSWLAAKWLKPGALDPSTVVETIRLMAFVLALRWVEQVYRGALVGLQDQVWINAINAALATARWGGAFLIVTFGWPSILAFFIWQAFMSCIAVAFLARRTYKMLPSAPRPGVFTIRALAEVRGFASGMFLGAILSFSLTQADKIIISKLLSLDQLGYYMLAVTLSGGLLQLAAPMNNAIYPRLTMHVTGGESGHVERTYLLASELMAAIIVPPAMLLVVFPEPVLLAWIGDDSLTHTVAPLLSLLAAGTLLNSLMNLPYLLQISHGWTSFTIWKNIVATSLALPALLFAIPGYGTLGAAAVWLVLNLGYVLIEPTIMFRRLLVHNKWRWYRCAVFVPLCACGVVSAVLSLTLPVADTRQSALVIITVALFCMYAALLMALTNVRAVARRVLGSTLSTKSPS